jgi:hypothetical protein
LTCYVIPITVSLIEITCPTVRVMDITDIMANDDPIVNTKPANLTTLLALGSTLAQAVGNVLQGSLTEIAGRHGFRQTEVSMCLRNYPGRSYPRIREALAADLGITRLEIDELIENGGR